MIAIVDYRMGNLRSVQKGFEHAGVADVVVTDDPAVIERADGVVLPGVGAFRDAAANLRESGCEEALLRRVRAGTPFLGICLGLQLLADVGLEDGEWEGLGIVPGTCERLPGGVKVPHIGWNTVEYGVRFAAAVQVGPKAFAVQFHPEKSSSMGLKLLANFGSIVEGAKA